MALAWAEAMKWEEDRPWSQAEPSLNPRSASPSLCVSASSSVNGANRCLVFSYFKSFVLIIPSVGMLSSLNTGSQASFRS